MHLLSTEAVVMDIFLILCIVWWTFCFVELTFFVRFVRTSTAKVSFVVSVILLSKTFGRQKVNAVRMTIPTYHFTWWYRACLLELFRWYSIGCLQNKIFNNNITPIKWRENHLIKQKGLCLLDVQDLAYNLPDSSESFNW